MLLHDKRIMGNLGGIGYVNPYTYLDHSQLWAVPVSLEDRKSSLIMKSKEEDRMKKIKMQKELEGVLGFAGHPAGPVRPIAQDIATQRRIADDKAKQEAEEKQKPLSGSGQRGGDYEHPEQFGIRSNEPIGYQPFNTSDSTAELLYKGLLDVASTYASAYSGAPVNQYGRQINPNPNWRNAYPNERHLKDSSGSTYNYLGPGTNVRNRLARGDPPLDGNFGLDAQARTHDIDYLNARNLRDVRRADRKFVRNVKLSNATPIAKAMAIQSINAEMGQTSDLRPSVDPITVATTKDTTLSGSGQMQDIIPTKKVTQKGKPTRSMLNKMVKQWNKKKGALKKKVGK